MNGNFGLYMRRTGQHDMWNMLDIASVFFETQNKSVQLVLLTESFLVALSSPLFNVRGPLSQRNCSARFSWLSAQQPLLRLVAEIKRMRIVASQIPIRFDGLRYCFFTSEATWFSIPFTLMFAHLCSACIDQRCSRRGRMIIQEIVETAANN